ncbi:MAG: hypothetical protein LBB39_01065 [Mycoplasmataceae bacterium]|nr:hypothetical protein [Mycoplasmataceae bacterium]
MLLNKKIIKFIIPLFAIASVVSLSTLLTSCSNQKRTNKYINIATFSNVEVDSVQDSVDLMEAILNRCDFCDKHSIPLDSDNDSLIETTLLQEITNKQNKYDILYWEYLNYEANLVYKHSIPSFKIDIEGSEAAWSIFLESLITTPGGGGEAKAKFSINSNKEILITFSDARAVEDYNSHSLYYRGVDVVFTEITS